MTVGAVECVTDHDTDVVSEGETLSLSDGEWEAVKDSVGDGRDKVVDGVAVSDLEKLAVGSVVAVGVMRRVGVSESLLEAETGGVAVSETVPLGDIELDTVLSTVNVSEAVFVTDTVVVTVRLEVKVMVCCTVGEPVAEVGNVSVSVRLSVRVRCGGVTVADWEAVRVAASVAVVDLVGSRVSVLVSSTVPVSVREAVAVAVAKIVTLELCVRVDDHVPVPSWVTDVEMLSVAVSVGLSDGVRDRVVVDVSSWLGVGVLTRVSVFVFVAVGSVDSETVVDTDAVGMRLIDLVDDFDREGCVNDTVSDSVWDLCCVPVPVYVSSSDIDSVELSCMVNVLRVQLIVSEDDFDRDRSCVSEPVEEKLVVLVKDSEAKEYVSVYVSVMTNVEVGNEMVLVTVTVLDGVLDMVLGCDSEGLLVSVRPMVMDDVLDIISVSVIVRVRSSVSVKLLLPVACSVSVRLTDGVGGGVIVSDGDSDSEKDMLTSCDLVGVRDAVSGSDTVMDAERGYVRLTEGDCEMETVSVADTASVMELVKLLDKESDSLAVSSSDRETVSVGEMVRVAL